MKKINILSNLLILILLLSSSAYSQMRQIHESIVENNHLKKFSFYNAKEGYSAFSQYLTYTQDSGRTYLPKHITFSNVDYGNYNVNILFGFTINGCKAFNKDTVIAYGHYGFVPAVLYSTNQGNSFKLIYHALNDPNELNGGILDMVFPQNSNIGYAIDEDRILKTVNKGLSWTPVVNDNNAGYTKLFFLSDLIGFAIAGNKVIKTTNGGLSWQLFNLPTSGQVLGLFFFDNNKGYISQISARLNVYFTSNGGASWELKTMNEFGEPFGSLIHFINDSTAYRVGEEFGVLKTTDSTKHWEKLERDNNYVYLGYSHNDFQFLSASQFWWGGAHGFISLTTNGGGKTLPTALFKIDPSQLNITQTINLINYSKPGSSYQWFRNNVSIATSYNSNYISTRTTIDTIRLVVTKNGYTDTATEIIDTRPLQPPCNSNFTMIKDTSTVKFTSTINNLNTKHYWYFGDGSSDSVSVNPIHHYTALGNYSVKHIVRNTISNCKDSTNQSVSIIRTQNCLVPTFIAIADTFYTNKYIFTPSLAQLTESSCCPIEKFYWDFDNNFRDSSTSPYKYNFDTSRFYNIKLSVKNAYTGCITTIVKPINVQMVNGCNATFIMYPPDSSGFFIPKYEEIRFNGKPNARNRGKSNTWTINGWDINSTGNTNRFTKKFYSINQAEAHFFEDGFGQTCNEISTKEYHIDSLSKTIRHTMYDSITNCTEIIETSITVPTRRKITITAIPDPLFPNYVRFTAYNYNISPTLDTTPYVGRWRFLTTAGILYTNGYNATNSFPYSDYLFRNSSVATVAIGCKECDGGTTGGTPQAGYRQVYWRYYAAPGSVGPCDFYPPIFTYTKSSSNPNTYTFLMNDRTWAVNAGSLGHSKVWYFGNGDSSNAYSPIYTFANSGPHQVTLKFYSSSGCSRDTTIIINPAPVCNIVPNFSYTRDMVIPAKIYFNNLSLPDTGTLSYKWYFGNGDSSSLKNPTYNYSTPGNYRVILSVQRNANCFSKDTTFISISSSDICNIHADFTSISDTLQTNKVNFFDISSPANVPVSRIWDFGDGNTDTSKNPTHLYSSSGTYRVCLTIRRDSTCSNIFCDSVSVTLPLGGRIMILPNPTGNQLNIKVTFETPGIYNLRILNSNGFTLTTKQVTGVSGVNSYSFDISAMFQGIYFLELKNSNKTISQRFIKGL